MATNAIMKIQNIREYEPAGQISTQQLRDDWSVVFAWHSKQVEGKELNDSEGNVISSSQVFNTAKGIFRELVRRGGTTFTSPQEMENRTSGQFFTRILKDVVAGDAVYLEPPHGQMVHKGKKKLIVLKTKITGHILTPIYLESGGECYGIIRLDYPKQMSLRTFKQQEKAHGISEDERRRIWPRVTSFWAYKFSLVVKFSKPVAVRTHPSDRQFLAGQKVVMKQFPVSELSNEELLDEISDIHQTQKAVVRSKNPENQMDAEWSKQNNKIRLGKFFYHLKTAISISTSSEAKVYSLDQAVNYMRKLAKKNNVEWPVCAIQKKYS